MPASPPRGVAGVAGALQYPLLVISALALLASFGPVGLRLLRAPRASPAEERPAGRGLRGDGRRDGDSPSPGGAGLSAADRARGLGGPPVAAGRRGGCSGLSCDRGPLQLQLQLDLVAVDLHLDLAADVVGDVQLES